MQISALLGFLIPHYILIIFLLYLLTHLVEAEKWWYLIFGSPHGTQSIEKEDAERSVETTGTSFSKQGSRWTKDELISYLNDCSSDQKLLLSALIVDATEPIPQDQVIRNMKVIAEKIKLAEPSKMGR